MINRQQLLTDLQKLLTRIEADLLERSESTEVPEVPAALHAEYEKAAKAERTAQNYEDWRTDKITQAAAAWVLSCVFVRFLEDNSLIDPPKIAGPGDRLARARDEHELYFRSHPQHTDREYLLSIFAELAKLPGTKDIFGEHNAINDLPNWLSGDAAGELLNFFQKIDASTGDLVHDFNDPNWDTRFLGDLYQDLSEAARKKFALLQTPDFVEEFILDRTLEPALNEFGLVPNESCSPHFATARGGGGQRQGHFRMIDPACGSGHFLLGGFSRIVERWLKLDPSTNIRELVQRALDSVYGVDINPFAIAIARFRLLVKAIHFCGILNLRNSPEFELNLACGDSLYHGRQQQMLLDGIETDESHYFSSEDADKLRAILKECTYHVVVANPPFIICRDRAVNQCYRQLYPKTCHMKYSLSVPFLERIFALAIRSESSSSGAGYTGQITANSFMKREFGRPLIETLIPKINLTHVVDTQCAHLPGHGTSTVILFGRNSLPIESSVRVVSTLKNEEPRPVDPANGKVWLSILAQIDVPNSASEYATTADVYRETLLKHPWSIGGGGLAELKEQIDSVCSRRLQDVVQEIGVMAIAGDDEVFVDQEKAIWDRRGIVGPSVRKFVTGDDVRDWRVLSRDHCLFPYDERGKAIPKLTGPSLIYLWPYRQTLSSGLYFGKTKSERRMNWFEYAIVMSNRSNQGRFIQFAAVATHNQFAFANERSVCNRHSPIIILRDDTDEGYHAILAALNSSTACFWMKQVFQDKGGGGIGGGISAEAWERRFEFDATKLRALPLPDTIPPQVREITKATLERCIPRVTGETYPGCYLEQQAAKENLIFFQEELDWAVYRLYGLVDEDLTYTSDSFGIRLGERAFEIVLARKKQVGDVTTSWFERHGAAPSTEIPAQWPAEYKRLVERRIELIESDLNIRLIEQAEFKRRWNSEPWELQLNRRQRESLLLRLELKFDVDGRMTGSGDGSIRSTPLGEIAIYSVAQLADAARRDPQFMEVAELYRNDPAFDVQALVEELVLAESVPHLPILRYKDSGLRKRAEWEKTWDLQRREDAGEAVGTIPVPPKYTSADFISTGGARYWSLRGKLDVPKERWISFPHCEGPDGTLVICWAGYDHLQQAQAISAYYVRVQTEFGGSDDPRLIPLLASLIELLPWLKQWHNEPNANFDGLRMGDYFEGFVNEEARNLGKTLAEIKAWVPPKKVAKAKASKSKKKSTKEEVEAEE